jgi:hypothetical protein
VTPNLAMLVNVVEAVERIASGLQHVSLMQGYKVHGAHLGPFKTPARETDPATCRPSSTSINRAISRTGRRARRLELVSDPICNQALLHT